MLSKAGDGAGDTMEFIRAETLDRIMDILVKECDEDTLDRIEAKFKESDTVKQTGKNSNGQFGGSVPGLGRPKESKNQIPAANAKSVLDVVGELGGEDALLSWAKRNPDLFWTCMVAPLMRSSGPHEAYTGF